MKKVFILTFALLVIIVPSVVSATETTIINSASISGKIIDYDENTLKNATVTASAKVNKENVSFETTTDEFGSYEFYNLPASDDGYAVVASLNGYCSAGREKIKENGSMVNLKLYESSFFEVESPMIFMSAGQSGGVYTAAALCDFQKIEYDWADAPTYEELDSGVGLTTCDRKNPQYVQYTKKSQYATGEKYKTVVLIMGRNYLGMGGPMPTFSWELNRIRNIIQWARENEITLIGMHLEGTHLRNQYENEQIIDLVAPECDMLITIAASNYDDRFTKIAIENDIPIHVAAKARDLEIVFVDIFKNNQIR